MVHYFYLLSIKQEVKQMHFLVPGLNMLRTVNTTMVFYT